MKRAIIVMAKVPLAGTVKTRLQNILSPEKCAALARAFLQDAITKSKSVSKNIILAYSPAAERKFLEEIAPPEIVLLEQKGEDLGARMMNAFASALRENSAVVMIGTDSPTFPADYLSRAFAALDDGAEIVLGKTADGGFYLIGLRRLLPEIFDNVEWSTPLVFEQFSKNIKRAKIEKISFVPGHYDVDTPDDFLLMKKAICADEALQKLAPETSRWLAENGSAT